MKITTFCMPANFSGGNNNYEQKINEKSNTTLKYATGTAIAGAALLAVYFLTGRRGAKTGKFKPNTNTQNILEKQTPEIPKIITDKTSNDVLERLNPEILKIINQITVSSDDFRERLIKIMKN